MKQLRPKTRFVISLSLLCIISVSLLVGRYFATDSTRYLFLIWNILLAAIAPLIAWWLVIRIRRHGWLHWQQLLLTFLWIAFLPNSFYLITDLVHLKPNYEASLVYDTIMLQSFVLSGLALGYTSVVMVHKQLEKRLRPSQVWMFVGAIFLVCSFAIYLGRFSRWNSWDLLLRPAGLLFDVSDSFLNPANHGDTYLTTLTFFGVLFVLYLVIWWALDLSSRRS